MIDTARALSSASPTLPIDADSPCSVRDSVKLDRRVLAAGTDVDFGDQETQAWLHTVGMLHLRILAPSKLTDDVSRSSTRTRV